MIEKLKPNIEISENYTARNTIGCEYYLKVFLINDDFEIVDFFKFQDIISEFPAFWNHVSHTFLFDSLKYKSLRYVLYYHAGKDRRGWAGYYGVKITNGSVKLIIS